MRLARGRYSLSSRGPRPSLAAVRWIKLVPILFALLLPGVDLFAATAKVVKVLPHRLDRAGRHTLSPSLYERDAYQDHLRKRPEECSGLRFDVQWKADPGAALKLRVEMRGSLGKDSTQAMLESNVTRRGLFSQWSAITLEGEDFKKFGELVAWRATLWDGDVRVGEQKSFLW